MRISCGLAMMIACLTLGTAPAAEKPHIIFILTDDLGPGDLSFSGGRIVETPAIDSLARAGIRFSQYYTAAPICSPSRCGLITGQFPARWRITSFLQTRAGNQACGMADFLDPQAPSLPRILKTSGYATAHFGKWHLGGGRDVVNPPPFAAYGYDEHAGTWESPQPHPDITATPWIWSNQDKVKRWERSGFFVDQTLDFLARHGSKPCFVNLWLDDPHTPWVPDAAAGNGASTRANLQSVMREIDRQVGRLREGLKRLGLEQRTLIVFTSDNGPLPTLQGARSGGLRGCKLSLYEGGIRVPCAIAWPGTIPAGREDRTTVLAAVDMLPTLASLAGAALPPGLAPDGEDRSAAWRGTPMPNRRPLLWEYGRNDSAFAYPTPRNGARANDRSPPLAIRDGPWKLLMAADGSARELYDLDADPAETKNLAEKSPEVAARLAESLRAWRQSWP